MRSCFDGLAFVVFVTVFISAVVKTATAQVPAALRDKTILVRAEAELCIRPKTSSSKACSIQHRTEKTVSSSMYQVPLKLRPPLARPVDISVIKASSYQ